MLATIFLVGLIVRLALLAANPHPNELSGLSSPNGNIAHNVLHSGRWLVVNHQADAQLVTEDGSIVDPEDADLSEADGEAEVSSQMDDIGNFLVTVGEQRFELPDVLIFGD